MAVLFSNGSLLGTGLVPIVIVDLLESQLTATILDNE